MPLSNEEALFALALAIPATERAAWLDCECGDDAALRARLGALLAAHDEPDKLTATAAPASKPTMKVEFPEDQLDESVGQTIGRYRLLERVGEGGCGVGYVAEQTEPVRRRVALKVIKPGMDTRQVVACHTRSDIYSLGVLLYELLTGSTPFDSKELMQSGLDEMRKIIREREPVRPSTRVSQTLSSAPAAGSLASRPSSLASDLDWIVMKCLEKDRSRRYETANGLATDIQRHLNNEPIIARPPTAAYKFRKAWRRNKVVYSAGAAVVVALIAGMSVSLWQMQVARSADPETGQETLSLSGFPALPLLFWRPNSQSFVTQMTFTGLEQYLWDASAGYAEDRKRNEQVTADSIAVPKSQQLEQTQ